MHSRVLWKPGFRLSGFAPEWVCSMHVRPFAIARTCRKLHQTARQPRVCVYWEKVWAYLFSRQVFIVSHA